MNYVVKISLISQSNNTRVALICGSCCKLHMQTNLVDFRQVFVNGARRILKFSLCYFKQPVLQ